MRVTPHELHQLLTQARRDARTDQDALTDAMHDRINELVGELNAALTMVRELLATVDRLRTGTPTAGDAHPPEGWDGTSAHRPPEPAP